jgi:hypothetical protein
MNRILLLLLLSVVTGCGPQTSNQVVLATDDGAKRLIYDCSNFRPQVESAEQLQVLAAVCGQTIRHASEHQRVVTAQALMDAYKARDWRRLEQLVVEYRCANRAEFQP